MNQADRVDVETYRGSRVTVTQVVLLGVTLNRVDDRLDR